MNALSLATKGFLCSGSIGQSTVQEIDIEIEVDDQDIEVIVDNLFIGVAVPDININITYE